MSTQPLPQGWQAASIGPQPSAYDYRQLPKSLEGKGVAVTALVLGIFGFCFSLIPDLWIIACPLAVVGLVFGLNATTNLTTATPEFVIDAYHQLWHIEKSFRMSKHDLQARPIYHHLRESIDAHLSIVVAALAISHHIEHQTGWSIKKFVRTARRYRNVKIKAGRQILTAADPLPDDLRAALAEISGRT